MKPLRPLLLVLLCALASACATTRDEHAAVSPRADAVVVAATTVAAEPTTVPSDAASEAPTPASDEAISQTATAQDASSGGDDAETDFAAIYGDATGSGEATSGVGSAAAYDPWEKYNRRVHGFNSAVDRAVAKPLAKAYVAAVPRPLRAGVGNFFDNLGEPVTVVNSLLQGNPRGAANALGRFLLNSTVGIGGLIDVAGPGGVGRIAKLAVERDVVADRLEAGRGVDLCGGIGAFPVGEEGVVQGVRRDDVPDGSEFVDACPEFVRKRGRGPDEDFTACETDHGHACREMKAECAGDVRAVSGPDVLAELLQHNCPLRLATKTSRASSPIASRWGRKALTGL